ncbi:ALF repeat-containing protein [Streptomyces sp. NPDC055681]
MLRAAAEDAVDGTPEEMRYFLEHGQYEMTASLLGVRATTGETRPGQRGERCGHGDAGGRGCH